MGSLHHTERRGGKAAETRKPDPSPGKPRQSVRPFAGSIRRPAYDPPTLRGVVALRAPPRAGLLAFALALSSALARRPPPSASRSRPPTDFFFGFSAASSSAAVSAFGSNSLPSSSTWATSAASPRRRPTRSSRV